MANLDDIPGSLLRKPSGKTEEELQRDASTYHPLHTFRLNKEKPYQQQFADMYFLRLTKIKPAVDAVASAHWDDKAVVGDEVPKHVERVLDIRQGELCWTTGTVYVDMPLKPNVLEDVAKDRWLSEPTSIKRYYSEDGEDAVMLEDESGRIRLVGDALKSVSLVTGCIIAVLGTENINGELEVLDLKLPDLAPQPERWALSTSSDEDDSKQDKIEKKKKKKHKTGGKANSGSSSNRGKIAIVSGLNFSAADASHALELALLLEYLLGEALDPSTQQELSHMTRLIIAGNSISLLDDHDHHHRVEEPSQSSDIISKKANKKYGYDARAYNPLPAKLLDEFLAALLPTMPVTLIPGAQDPANASFPQQPVHAAMFPNARTYTAGPIAAGEAGWFDTVTNPWEGEVEGWRLLGTGGQNVDDIFKYVGSQDRLGMMELMCRWRCCAPTAPDTLWSYPFQDDDPFVMKTSPHVFFVGCQPRFATKMISGVEGQSIRLIAVPSFAESKEIVLLDTETLDVERVRIVAG